MKQLPNQPISENERTLALEYRERFTGIAGVAITLAQTPLQTTDGNGLELVFKNGVLVDNTGGAGGYTIEGASITFGTALIVGDVVIVRYCYRN